MSNQARGCIFCGGKPLTREHLFENWAINHLNTRATTVAMSTGKRLTGLLHYGFDREWVTGGKPAFTVRCVCAPCNGGWINEIGTEAAQYIRPMLDGATIELPAEARRAIAAWAFLRGIILRYGSRDADPVNQQWLDAIRDRHRPPDGVGIWIAQYLGNRLSPAFGESISLTDIQSTSSSDEPAVRPDPADTMFLSLLIGEVAVKIFGVRDFDAMPTTSEITPLIWPQTGEPIEWPPPLGLTNEGLVWFFETGLNPKPTTSLLRRRLGLSPTASS